ncbi:MAG TPA: hypothetical protein GX531_07700 [Methanothermobacter sp.]|nr:hypothetical protein [Methanothermobacter sp.]
MGDDYRRVDTETEAKIAAALEKLMGGRTTIVIVQAVESHEFLMGSFFYYFAFIQDHNSIRMADG